MGHDGGMGWKCHGCHVENFFGTDSCRFCHHSSPWTCEARVQYALESSDSACSFENDGDDLGAVRCGKCGAHRPGWELRLCRVTCDAQAVRVGSAQWDQAERKRMVVIQHADLENIAGMQKAQRREWLARFPLKSAPEPTSGTTGGEQG